MSPSRLLLAFMVVSITGGAAAGVMQLLVPLYAISLSVSQAGVGLIRGLAQFGGLLTSLPGGFLIDRYGARRVYTVACLLDGLTIILIPNFTAVPYLTAFLFLEGALGTLRWTTINSAFFSRLETFGHSRAGWTRASLAVGANFIGPLIGGALASRFSYHSSYLVVGLIVAAPACAIPLFRTCAARGAAPQREIESIGSQFRELIANRLLWRIALLQSAGISSNSAYLIYIVLLAVGTHGFTAASASRLLASQGVAFVVSMFWGGRFIGRYSFRTLYCLAFGLQITGLATTGITSSYPLLMIGGAAFGLGSGMLTTISFSRLGGLTGQKGRLSGLFFLITGTGVALGPLWAGLLVALWGIRAAFVGFIPVMLLAMFCVLIPRRSEDISELSTPFQHALERR